MSCPLTPSALATAPEQEACGQLLGIGSSLKGSCHISAGVVGHGIMRIPQPMTIQTMACLPRSARLLQLLRAQWWSMRALPWLPLL